MQKFFQFNFFRLHLLHTVVNFERNIHFSIMFGLLIFFGRPLRSDIELGFRSGSFSEFLLAELMIVTTGLGFRGVATAFAL